MFHVVSTFFPLYTVIFCVLTNHHHQISYHSYLNFFYMFRSHSPRALTTIIEPVVPGYPNKLLSSWHSNDQSDRSRGSQKFVRGVAFVSEPLVFSTNLRVFSSVSTTHYSSLFWVFLSMCFLYKLDVFFTHFIAFLFFSFLPSYLISASTNVWSCSWLGVFGILKYFSHWSTYFLPIDVNFYKNPLFPFHFSCHWNVIWNF